MSRDNGPHSAADRSLQPPSPLADRLLAWLRAEDWIKSARIHYDCESFVVEYEPEKAQSLDDMLALLCTLSVADLEALVASLRAPEPQSVEGSLGTYKPPLQDWPLALPTLSLTLAFSTNPAS